MINNISNILNLKKINFIKIYKIFQKDVNCFASRRFKFDKIFDSQSLNEEEIKLLDEVSMVSLKTLQIPTNIINKLHNIAKQFIKKKELQKLGRYLIRKYTARNCVEIPRILPSKLLCETEEEKNRIEKLLDKKSYKCLKEFIQSYKNNQTIKDLDQLALTYAEDSRHRYNNISFFPEISLAYTIHFFNGRYGVIYRILNEIRKRVPDYFPKSVLNYSALSSASIIALHEIYKYTFDNILTVESSEHLTSITKYLVDHIQNVKYQMNIYNDHVNKFDMIILSHILLNSYDYNSRHLLIKNLWNRLNKSGILIIVENGTTTGFRMLHSIREMFITELKYNQFHIISPCPHSNICPLSLTGKDWCHFSQRVFKLSHHIYAKGSKTKNVEEVKYSYLVIRKCEGIITKYQSENDTIKPHEKSYFWSRIIFPPIKANKHVLIDVCSYPHNFERLVVTKSSSKIVNLKSNNGNILKGYGYKIARKIMWGDLWRFTKRINRPDARLYTPEDTKKKFYRLYQKQKQEKQQKKQKEILLLQEKKKIKIMKMNIKIKIIILLIKNLKNIIIHVLYNIIHHKFMF